LRQFGLGGGLFAAGGGDGAAVLAPEVQLVADVQRHAAAGVETRRHEGGWHAVVQALAQAGKVAVGADAGLLGGAGLLCQAFGLQQTGAGTVQRWRLR
jgi:hypothetical protein